MNIISANRNKLSDSGHNLPGHAIRSNNFSLERPSDTESDNGVPFANSIVFSAGVVSENQPEGDIDHRHLDAQFHSKGRTNVFRESEFTLRGADDLEILRLSLHNDRAEADGES